MDSHAAGDGASAPRMTVLGDPARLAVVARLAVRDPRIRVAMDRWAALLSRILHAPVAQVNLVTDRAQVPAGSAGGEAWTVAVGLERSYCRHVVDSGQPLVVRDAREHPLLRDNLATREAGIVAYASAPLTLAGEHTVGSLCAVDFRPREWSDEELGVLRDLAGAVVAEMERAGVEAALRESEQRLRLATDAARLGTWELDLPAGRVRLDERTAVMLGLSAGTREVRAARVLARIPRGDRERVMEAARAVAAGKGSREMEFRVHRRPGHTCWIFSAGQSVRADGGAAERLVGITLDVTARKRAELERERVLAAEQKARREAEAARAEAEEASRAKTQFLSAMSHELRTPLNAVVGYGELMALGMHGPLTEPQLQALGRIRANGTNLLALINDVLNYTRIEAGGVEYHTAEVPLAEVLAELDAVFAPEAEKAGLCFAPSACDPSLRACGDPEKVRQVLVNLLGNAVKFSPPGGTVSVACERRGRWIAVHVADTGAGIAPGMLDCIFEPFVQIREAAAGDSSRKGVGLGLAISRDLARGMGGDLTVRSAPGQGSTFTLTLPVPAG